VPVEQGAALFEKGGVLADTALVTGGLLARRCAQA
jgi:hypothetical protein